MSETYFLHGFTQSAASWDPVLAQVANGRALDLPGHGSASSVTPGFDTGVASLVARGGKGNWVGYSMGGRYALHLALAHPHLVDRLVLVGAHPGIEDAGERRDRRKKDEALAVRVERVGVESFLDEWLAQPLFQDLTPQSQNRTPRLRNSVSGLAAALRGASTGVQSSLWDRLQELRMPVLYLAGARDQKYCRVGERVVSRLGGWGSLAVVPDTGHAVPFENPGAFSDCLRAWDAEFSHS